MNTNTIVLALDLGKYKSVACVHDFSAPLPNVFLTPGNFDARRPRCKRMSAARGGPVHLGRLGQRIERSQPTPVPTTSAR